METTPDYTEKKSRDPRNPRLEDIAPDKEPLLQTNEKPKLGSDEKNRLAQSHD